jgi:16S rRNA (cytosine967-C5)-methyltransferase
MGATGGAGTDRVRRLTLESLARIGRGDFLDEALAPAREELADDLAARGRLLFLTAGTVKWRGRLDHELDRHLPQGLVSLPPPVRDILRLALFELRLAETPSYAAVDAAVHLTREAGLSGLSGLVNGLLRRAVREGELPVDAATLSGLAVTTSHPEWLLDRITTLFGSTAARRYADWNNLPPPVWARVDTGRRSIEEALALLSDEGVEAAADGPVPGYLRLPSGTLPADLRGLEEGWLTIQDPSAGLAVLALDPIPGQRVADLFAAPGGKATHLAERLGGRGEVAATDSDETRRRRLLETVRRHGAPNLNVVPWDELLARGPVFDGVLADVPCSNLGVLRRRADARWRVAADEPARMARLQAGLIARAAELVRPGGVLVYSTCTLLPEENEQVVADFLHSHGAFERVGLGMSVPGTFITDTGAVFANPWEHGIDGAYAVRLKRSEGG